MAADKPAAAGGDLDAMDRRLAELNRKMEEADRAAASAKFTGRIMTVLIVVVALLGVYLLLSPLIQAFSNTKPYQDAMAKELTDRVMPHVSEELQKSLQVVGPKVGSAVVEQVKGRQEEVTAELYKQVNLLMEGLRSHSEERLSAEVAGLEGKIRERIERDLPELKDKDQAELIMGNATLAVENAVQQLIADNLEVHINSLVSIGERINGIEVPPHLKEMSDDQLSEELTNALGNYAIVVLQAKMPNETRDVLKRIAEDPAAANGVEQ